MSTDVLTRSYDNSRSGANTTETILTSAAVDSRGIKILQTLQTPDDPRLDAQPLYLSAVNIGGQAHNVIYQATMGNTVYAWDADTGVLLWKTNLGMPINSETAIDSHNTNVHLGIMSTPVIDRAAGVLYACAWITPDKSGKWQNGQHFVVGLDVKTGNLVKPLLNLEGASFNPGNGQPVQQFVSSKRKQRSGLAITKGALIICFGSLAEADANARGWVIAVDTAGWKLAAAWCSSVNGGAGIWMSGSAPAIQSDGSIWFTTGNGSFNGVYDFAESIIHLNYSPAANGRPAAFTLIGSWTPWDDSDRTKPGDPQAEAVAAKWIAKLGNAPKATNFRLLPTLIRMGYDPMVGVNLPWGDQDLGAAGIVLIESMGVALVSSKDGILYTINLAEPTHTGIADLNPASVPANYAKLASPPILYTYYDPNINPAPSDCRGLNRFSAGVTHHLHGTPVAWSSAAHGQMHFCGGENGNLRAWTLKPDHSSAYLACSSAYASANITAPPGGMPGWSITLSANGQNDGVVWGMIPYGDSNMAATNGRLLAYDAVNLAAFNGGAGEIAPLWDSQDWNWNFLHPKFNRPIVADGKLIVPTYDGRVFVIGLA